MERTRSGFILLSYGLQGSPHHDNSCEVGLRTLALYCLFVGLADNFREDEPEMTAVSWPKAVVCIVFEAISHVLSIEERGVVAHLATR